MEVPHPFRQPRLHTFADVNRQSNNPKRGADDFPIGIRRPTWPVWIGGDIDFVCPRLYGMQKGNYPGTTNHLLARTYTKRIRISLGFALAKGLIRGLKNRYPDPSIINHHNTPHTVMLTRICRWLYVCRVECAGWGRGGGQVKSFINVRNKSLQAQTDSHPNVLPLAIHSDAIGHPL